MPCQMLACSFLLNPTGQISELIHSIFLLPWDLVVGGMTFSHMDIGELINLGRPPPPPPTTPNRGSPSGRPFITYSFSLKCAVCCTYGNDMFVEYSLIDMYHVVQ